MSCPVSARDVVESVTEPVTAPLAPPDASCTTHSFAGSRVCTSSRSFVWNATAIGTLASPTVTEPFPPGPNQNRLLSVGSNPLPAATTALDDPSGDNATSTGSVTPGNATLTSGAPSTVSAVRTLMTAPDSGP